MRYNAIFSLWIRVRLTLILFTLTLLLFSCNGRNQPLNRATPPILLTPSPSYIPSSPLIPSPILSPLKEPVVQKKKIPSLTSYFPQRKDVSYFYQGEGNEYATYRTYVDYISPSTKQLRINNGGTSSISVYQLRKGELLRSFRLGEVYYRYNFTDQIENEEILLKEPLQQGTRWFLKDGSIREITALEFPLQTPYGKLNCIEVSTQNKTTLQRDYYAPEIGLVKTSFLDKASKTSISSQLSRIETKATVPLAVKFYFLDFENARFTEEIRNFNLKTNENFEKIFEKAWKTPISGTKTESLLPPKVRIIEMKPDLKNQSATLNLSSNFVSEINAGSSFEGMLLNGLTNTVGEYFGVQKVAILLDGQPYQSGHFQMKEGEYFEVEKMENAEKE